MISNLNDATSPLPAYSELALSLLKLELFRRTTRTSTSDSFSAALAHLCMLHDQSSKVASFSKAVELFQFALCNGVRIMAPALKAFLAAAVQEKSVGTVFALFELFQHQHHVDEYKELLSDQECVDLFCEGSLVSKQFSRIASLIQFFRDRGLAPTEKQQNFLIEACLKNSRFDKAAELTDELRSKHENKSLPESTLLTLIRGCSRQLRLDKASEFLDELRSEYGKGIQNTPTLNALVEACVKSDNLQLAESLFGQHLPLMTEDDHPTWVVDLQTFSAMIRGLCRFGHLSRAFALFDIMPQKQINPDEGLYNALLDGSAKHSRHDLAFQVY